MLPTRTRNQTTASDPLNPLVSEDSISIPASNERDEATAIHIKGTAGTQIHLSIHMDNSSTLYASTVTEGVAAQIAINLIRGHFTSRLVAITGRIMCD